MKVELINYMPDALTTMAQAISKCYDTEPKESVVQGCIKKRHDSVTEHSQYVFQISEVSRAFLAQVTRHRHLQFTVNSQRYSLQDTYVLPDNLTDEQRVIMKDSIESNFSTYRRLIALGLAKEDARFVLPEATETKMVISGNYRAWMKFCELREDPHAQWEIRKFAFEVDRLIHETINLKPFKQLFGYSE